MKTLLNESWTFVLLQFRACIFPIIFFAVLWLSRQLPLGELPRYDFIFITLLVVQFLLLKFKFETWSELKVLCIFHLIGLVLEIFKTQPGVGSWSYPEFSYCKVVGVPLYSGFMYAAVASYICQSWRVFKLRLESYPSYFWSVPLSVAIYLNFFTHHFGPDLRWWLIAAVFVVFWRTKIYFETLPGTTRWLPMVAYFFCIGFSVWVAENISTYLGAWVYPDQVTGWKYVSTSKISSWFLLVIISFLVVADLKHVKRGHSISRPTAAAEMSRPG